MKILACLVISTLMLTSCITIHMPASPSPAQQNSAPPTEDTEENLQGKGGFSGLNLELVLKGESVGGDFVGETFSFKIPKDFEVRTPAGISMVLPVDAEDLSGISVLRIYSYPNLIEQDSELEEDARRVLDAIGVTDGEITDCSYEKLGEEWFLIIRSQYESEGKVLGQTLYCNDHFGILHVISCIDGRGEHAGTFEEVAHSLEVWDNRILY